MGTSIAAAGAGKAEDIHDAAGKCRVTGRQFVNDSGPASGDIDINSIDGPGSILFTVYGTHAGAPVGYKMSDASDTSIAYRHCCSRCQDLGDKCILAAVSTTKARQGRTYSRICSRRRRPRWSHRRRQLHH